FLGVPVGCRHQRPRDSELKVVASLVGQHQRTGRVEERARVFESPDFHYSSSSTTTAPPATRSPSAPCTLRTTPAYGETSGVSIFIASSTTSGWRCSTRSPSPTSTRRTVPGIGAGTALCSGPPPWA